MCGRNGEKESSGRLEQEEEDYSAVRKKQGGVRTEGEEKQ